MTIRPSIPSTDLVQDAAAKRCLDQIRLSLEQIYALIPAVTDDRNTLTQMVASRLSDGGNGTVVLYGRRLLFRGGKFVRCEVEMPISRIQVASVVTAGGGGTSNSYTVTIDCSGDTA